MPSNISEGQLKHAMSMDLLRFVRDHQPGEEDVIHWAQERNLVGSFHTLRKGGVLVVIDGRVVIASAHRSPDGNGVRCGNCMYWLDRGQVDTY